MTVSVVLNGAHSATRVSEATRTRIVEAAARLRYRPNAAARGLQRRRMDTLGVVAAIDGGVPNLYFLGILNGILEAASARGQNTTIFSVSHHWAADEKKILSFCDGRVDGMILIAPVLSASFVEQLALHMTYVTVQANEPPKGIVNLNVDDEGGAYLAVRHLIEHGHRRIVFFSGPAEFAGVRERIAGYRRALREAAIPVEEAWIVPGGYHLASGRERMAHLLDTTGPSELPTAIFCGNDAVAMGCLEAMAERNLRVPEDFSIIGFDDTLDACLTSPRLTTVAQPLRTLGARAVERVLALIDQEAAGDHEEGEAGESPAEVAADVLSVQLVVRGSVGPPPARFSVIK